MVSTRARVWCRGSASLSLSVCVCEMGTREKTQGRHTHVSTEEAWRGQGTLTMLSWNRRSRSPEPRDRLTVAEGGDLGADPLVGQQPSPG